MADAPAPAAPAPVAAPAAPAAPAPAPAAAPPPAAPAKVAAPKLSQIKADRRDRSIGAMKALPQASTAPRTESAPAAAPPPASDNSGAATPSTPAAAASPPATAQIDMDAEALKNFTELNRQLRESKTKQKNLEERIAGFGRFEKAQALAKDGKHYDAAREAGIDVDAALAELLGRGNANPTAGQIDAKLADEIADLKKFKEETVKEKEESKAAAAAQAEKADRTEVGGFVAANATKFPILAKAPELVDRVFEEFRTERAKQQEEGEAMSSADQAKLVFKILQDHEGKWAKVFGAPAPAPAAEAPASIDGARAGVREPPPSTKTKLTFDELKRERAAKRKTA